MTRSDSFDLLRTWRLYTSMKMRSASSTVWPWRSTSAIRVLTYFNAGIAFTSIIAFPPSAVSEPLRAIRSVERSTYDVLANIFTQTIAAQKRNGVLGQPMCTALQKSGCVPGSGNFPNPDCWVFEVKCTDGHYSSELITLRPLGSGKNAAKSILFLSIGRLRCNDSPFRSCFCPERQCVTPVLYFPAYARQQKTA